MINLVDSEGQPVVCAGPCDRIVQVNPNARGGRPPRFCSDACKQLAYRNRRAGAPEDTLSCTARMGDRHDPDGGAARRDRYYAPRALRNPGTGGRFVTQTGDGGDPQLDVYDVLALLDR